MLYKERCFKNWHIDLQTLHRCVLLFHRYCASCLGRKFTLRITVYIVLIAPWIINPTIYWTNNCPGHYESLIHICSACHDDAMIWEGSMHYWPFVWGIHVALSCGFPSQRSQYNCDIFLIIILNKRLNKHSSYWWFQMPRRCWCGGNIKPLICLNIFFSISHCNFSSQQSQQKPHYRPLTAIYEASLASSQRHQYSAFTVGVMYSWWHHQMETFSALLAICAGNSPVTGEFPVQRPVKQSFDVFFICAWMNDWLNNREAGDLRRYRVHCDVTVMFIWNSVTLDRITSITYTYSLCNALMTSKYCFRVCYVDIFIYVF